MFRIRYDSTGGQLRRGSTLRAATSRKRKQRTANAYGYGAGSGAVNRYSPVFERAEDPTLAEDFLPADPQTQNKIYRKIIATDAVAGPATEYWKDLTFGNRVHLSGLNDAKVHQFYMDAIESSGIEEEMPEIFGNYLTFGKFVLHMIMNERKGYWDEVIVDNLDFCHIVAPRSKRSNAVIDLQPSREDSQWATSSDPRIIRERRGWDSVLLKYMALGKPIPLAPENSMFLPRRAFADDDYGTSYLTRILPFYIYEKALMNASVAASRRRAGPLYHVTAWEDSSPGELSMLDELFAAAEEDPVGGRVVTRDGVTVNAIGGGGGDIWKYSDDFEFLSTAKMRALGISETFLNGDATYNSMETVLSVFLEKVRMARYHLTKKVIHDKILRQLAINRGYYKRPSTEVHHGYRIASRHREGNESELLLPVVEWDKPLEALADRDYLEMLQELENRGIPIPVHIWAQATGYDLDKALGSMEADLETRKKIYAYNSAIVEQAQEFGYDAEGNYVGLGGEDDEMGGMGDMGGGGGDLFEEEGFGGELEEGGGGGFEEEPVEMGGGEGGGETDLEGFGADLENREFPVKQPPKQLVTGKRPRKTQARRTVDLEEVLGDIPLWDNHGTLFGLRLRHAAKILNDIEHTDPERRHILAKNLPARLRTKEGLTPLQAEVAMYLGWRLGYLPPHPLCTETYEALSRFVAGKMNGNGLTKTVTREMQALSTNMRLVGSQKSDPSIWSSPMPQRERQLPHHNILSGVVG